LAWNCQAEGGVRGVYLGSLSISIKCPYWRCSYSSLRGAACKTEMLICNIGSSSFFFFGAKILPNFDLKNMISMYAKDFSWPKIARFRRNINPNCQIFLMISSSR
jgi:hypothetical protein